MRCLRCGSCCVRPTVLIVDDPALGVSGSNLTVSHANERCKHLRGGKAPYTCAIHDEPWYPETPCASHGQIECGNTYCRAGNYFLNGAVRPEAVRE